MNYFVGNLKTRIHLHFPYDFALLPTLREKFRPSICENPNNDNQLQCPGRDSVLVVVDCIPPVSPHDYSIH